MRIAICDDNIQTVGSLEQIVTTFFNEKSIEIELDTFLSGERLLMNLSQDQQKNYDLYFLDIQMEVINGIQTAEEIRKRDAEAFIVFITSHEEFMLDAFDVSAFHFLVKPINPDRLRNILEKISKKFLQQKNVFIYHINKKTFTIFYSQIQYFESDKRKVFIYTKNAVYNFYGRMKDIESTLPKYFVRIHKSYLVNLENVELVEGNIITMNNGEELIISRSNVNVFNEVYRKFIVARLG